jgi:CBS domain-containing protein
MRSAVADEAGVHLALDVPTAAGLMTPNPKSIRNTASIRDAVTLLTDRGLSAAPVIDDAGQPIGVLSRADILVHDRERADYPAAGAASAERTDPTRVGDLMTPAVFSVPPETPAVKVIEEMVALNVRQLFVVDRTGTLVGIITAFDILKHLHAAAVP